jgi:hypothetical protein
MMKVNGQKHSNCQNHRLDGLKDYTDLKSNYQNNPRHQLNLRKSVIQTKGAEIFNSILELL